MATLVDLVPQVTSLLAASQVHGGSLRLSTLNSQAPSQTTQAPEEQDRLRGAVADALAAVDDDGLASLLRDNMTPETIGSMLPLLKTIFFGCATASDASVARRTAVYTTIISCFADARQMLETKAIQAVISLLLVELEHFPPTALVALLDHYADLFHAGDVTWGAALEFVPALLSNVESLAEVPGLGISGAEFQSNFVGKIIRAPLPPVIVTPLTTMFKDISLTSPDLLKVFVRIFELFPALEIQELPSLVYHLLLLGSKGHRAFLLSSIIKAFDAQPPHARDTAVESTVALHVNFAMKQDLKLGKELLKVAKRDTLALTPFALSLLLSSALISRFEESVVEIVKHGLLASAKDAAARKASIWPLLVDVPLPPVSDLGAVLDTVVAATTAGWDLLVPPLLKVALALSDLTLRSVGYSRELLAQCHARAAAMLTTLFEAHEMARAPLLEQVFARVITLAPSAEANIALLATLVVRNPSRFIPFATKVKELVNYLSYLNLATAAALIAALIPLASVLPSFLDHLMLVLKKSLFNRELTSRLVALSGFVALLRALCIDETPASNTSHVSTASSATGAASLDLFSFSQAPPMNSNGAAAAPSTRAETNPDDFRLVLPNGHALALEILGHLKRCLTQQYAVRALLYDALPEVAARVPALGQDVLELLYFQLSKYYVKASTGPPLNLGGAVVVKPDAELVVVVDDLPGLLRAVRKALSAVAKPDGGFERATFAAALSTMFESICERSAACNAEDYELDKTANFDPAVVAGAANHTRATLLLGLHEVLIETAVSREAARGASNILGPALVEYAKYHELRKRVNGAAGTRKGKFKKGKGMGPGRSALLKALVREQSRTKLSWTYRVKMLKALFALPADGSVAHAPSLLRHIMLTLVADLSEGAKLVRSAGAESIGSASGSGSSAQDDALGGFGAPLNPVAAARFLARLPSVCSRLVPLLAAQFDAVKVLYAVEIDAALAAAPPPQVGDNYGDATPLLTLCLSALHEALAVVAPHPARFAKVLSSLVSGSADAPLRDAMGVLKSWASALLDAAWFEPLSSVLDTLVHLLDNHTPVADYVQHEAWARSFIERKAILDEGVARKLLHFFITVSVADVEDSQLKLAADVNRLFGGLDMSTYDGEVECEIVCDANGTVVVKQVLAGVEVALGHVEWLLSLLDSLPPSDRGSEMYKELFDALCVRLLDETAVLRALSSSSMRNGQASDVLLKSLIHFYRTSLLVIKHVLAVKKAKPSSRLQKLVANAAELAGLTYNLVNYLQSYVINASTARIAREQKLIPGLIFAIEQYEVNVLSLAQSSGTSLVRNFKRSRQDEIDGKSKKRARYGSDDDPPGSPGSSQVDDDSGRPHKR
ncbi:fanconi anemia group I protein [Thecamonas trahens ATCC 50062]|uniref:Fanconi anemia group I protein n=1 Tax=Thecamonas trahens ATCC 50062 TaxID=461836 RepID=A0A0L0DW61_THETB|nr:fanconi anemia group I protein [Thecamonas trahens ATCC 50062]KNC56316.1 fanconi anemia group I protein [Thecamonas trahens ATCC 50062]|eukprot:XP_013760833.1 fanconi anemia group I protein [Thecamonas trahens ATCC 50062]